MARLYFTRDPFLGCLLFIFPYTTAFREPNSDGLFLIAQQLPQSVTSWLSTPKRKDSPAEISSNATLVHSNHHLGFRVVVGNLQADALIGVPETQFQVALSTSSTADNTHLAKNTHFRLYLRGDAAKQRCESMEAEVINSWCGNSAQEKIIESMACTLTASRL